MLIESSINVDFWLLLSVLLSMLNKKRLKRLLLCDYSHFFAVRWTHKIAVKSPSHAQIRKVKEELFHDLYAYHCRKSKLDCAGYMSHLPKKERV
jgi:hypothetical protein